MSQLDDDPHTSAARRGQVVVVPGPRELFVDVDDDEDYEVLLEHVQVLREAGVYVGVVREHPSRRGLPHRHVYLTTNRDMSPVERIALQACLGSDRKREALSLARIWLNTGRPPTVFFENPDDVPAPTEPVSDWLP